MEYGGSFIQYGWRPSMKRGTESDTQRERCVMTDRQRGDDHVVMCDIGVMHLQAKKRQGLPETPDTKTKAWNRFSSSTIRESVVRPTLWFQTFRLQSQEQINFCCKLPSLW